jgi:shikimate kinase
MRVYLIGYMGSGKSRTGGEVAAKMNWSFTDMDDLFEEKYRISVLDFFEKYDENSFRNIERKLLHETILEDNKIIATGGGTPCFFDNMDFINNNGTSIYLKPGISLLLNRLRIVRKKRPLLKDIKLENLVDYIHQQLAERELFYSQAHFTLEGSDISAENVINLIKGNIGDR